VSKSGGHFVTVEQVENARRNVERYAWAAEQREQAIVHAERWASLSDEQLWGMVTGQMIGRSTNTSILKGCPVCNDTGVQGGGSFQTDVIGDPWKIECSSCGVKLPTNDFGAFYESGKGEDSYFDPSRADRSLLFNTDHPDPDDPLHQFCVDDGFGWMNEEGESFKLVGFYGHYGIWSEIGRAVKAFKEAYLLTGDVSYARKAGLMLARIADVYPNMDWSFWAKHGFYNSDGLSGRGRIYGRIWEPSLLKIFTECYDAVRDAWDDGDSLFEFLHAKQNAHGLQVQDSVDELCTHFDDHVLREAIDAIVVGDIHHNEPGDQTTMAILAIALDAEDTDDWLDWIFQPGYLMGHEPVGGHIPQLFAGEIDRDGVGSEAAPGYSLGWLRWPLGMMALDGLLESRQDYTRHRVRDFARYEKMFLAPIRLTAQGKFVPSIGDSGSTGSPGLGGITVEHCVGGFELYGDPVYAQMAYHLLKGDLEEVRGEIFDKAPESIRDRIVEVVEREGPLALDTDVMTGYGLALLRDGAGDSERTLWLYYGRNTGHGHTDRLNLGLYGFGLDLLPDLGYPEHARVWPTRNGWSNHTVSHNTVMVDRSNQVGTYSGKIGFVGLSENVQAIGVSSPDVYPQCSEYNRTSALVRVSEDDFYVIDLFGVMGGESHHFLFHAAEGDVVTEGLDLEAQEKGTYAGEDVGFGEFYDGEVEDYKGSGFQYLYDVRRCAHPEDIVSVDWTVKDTWKLLPESEASDKPELTDLHLRWNLLSPPGEVSLCHGDPPQNKGNNPRRLTYGVIASENTRSSFLSLIEAYKSNRVVNAICELEVTGGEGARAVRVELVDGRKDTIVFGDGNERLVAERFRFDGVFGVFSECKDGSGWATLVGGTSLAMEDKGVFSASPGWQGTITDFSDGALKTDAPPPDGVDLAGNFVSIQNDNDRDATYLILDVSRDGNETTIQVEGGDFVRGMVDNLDYAKGYLYDFDIGQPFSVVFTHHTSW
jgi:hypothetical protein